MGNGWGGEESGRDGQADPPVRVKIVNPPEQVIDDHFDQGGEVDVDDGRLMAEVRVDHGGFVSQDQIEIALRSEVVVLGGP
jgi:hypothetical protein